MSVFSGDFLGFQLGDIHSSSLNLTRVSSGGWYTDGLIPSFTDLVANIPGVDGTYYWDTNYTQRAITIDFAFDNVDDVNLAQIRRVLGFKGLKRLIFDETPYKQYMVKCSSQPTFRYICFGQDEYKIYKGEGSVQLVSYFPYAISVVEQKIFYNEKGCLISNPGDVDCNFKLIYDIDNLKDGLTIELLNSNEKKKLELDPIEQKDDDVYIQIDTSTHLIDGLDSNFKKTCNLYNGNIIAGNFFSLPIGPNRVKVSKEFYSGNFTPLYF